ncbi:glycine--tRNA ligase [bacterium]|jgi:glycyl-tRNA synthetase|nr:glycine--tRNA ligase [bacterium]MBT3903763.1 glycine--tRNA ligase [bacterium]MBT4578251.1 glycine--tRNA ligase [bacterium]MBT5345591.1 glycine--tRNA ligase [bacterium]MBT6131050.1 glycine--tRNA ligase [bacterium]
MSTPSKATLEKIVSLCKRRGFVYPSAQIYGGLNGVYATGPLGTILKENLRAEWRQDMLRYGDDILFIEGALLGPEAVWQASGHLENFHDPLIDCTNCNKRFRPDDDNIDVEKPCPSCGIKAWTDIKQFHMMFETQLGASAQSASKAYLRPETAQAIFTNFKQVLSSNRVKIPFGIAQVGKAFRNEITPKQFLFRMREFEQMEMEWFCAPDKSDADFDTWLERRKEFYNRLGLNTDRIRLRPHAKDELSHYSSKTSDVEYHFPFGWKELEGIAYRSDFDLTQHQKHSGKDLSFFDQEKGESFVPYVVECSVGTDRLFLTVLFDAYDEDEIGGDSRVVLRLAPQLAPIKAAFFPLSKEQREVTQNLFKDVRKTGISCVYDAGGSIGKRYRRQDEIGTPLCFTYDFDSPTDNCVTVRHRDTAQQERISIDSVIPYIQNMLKTD